MKRPQKGDPIRSWVTTLSWPDKVIAHCFPRFFSRYAPEEIRKQWAEHLAQKRARSGNRQKIGGVMANEEIMRTADVRVRVMELEGGACTEWHHHSEVDDFFVCLAGSVLVETRYADDAFVLHPGERGEVKRHRVHRVVNLHADKSEYLLVQGVGGYDFIEDQ
jgi:quercetin dioxygenase-like cupin family protein